MKVLINRIERAFILTKDLVNALPSESLVLKLGNLSSNKIGEQIWCVLGARESYFKAMKAGEWSGFSCSLKNTSNKEEMLNCLDASCNSILTFANNDELSDYCIEILFDLLEHEIQHHGQLIRFVYGNKLTFPKSWNDRYTV